MTTALISLEDRKKKVDMVAACGFHAAMTAEVFTVEVIAFISSENRPYP